LRWLEAHRVRLGHPLLLGRRSHRHRPM
jgi:hypothetical protein